MPIITEALFIPISEDEETDDMPHLNHRTFRVLNSATPSPTPAAPSPADMEKIAAIAEIVGTDGSPAATLAACWVLMGQLALDEEAALRQLSDRERTMVKEKGISAAGYLKMKIALRGQR